MTTEEKAKAYEMALEAAREELKQDLHESGVWAIKRIFPELAESEDERVIRTLFFLCKDHDWLNGATKEECLNWLEKQKERGPLTKDEKYTLHRIIEYLEDETCPSEWISLLYDIYCLPYEKQKGPENTSASTMAPSCWEIEQKEQKPEIELKQVTEEQLHNLNEAIKGLRMDGCERMADSLHSLYNILRRNKEQKPADLPAGFYVTLPDGKKYYTKEMRCNGMNVKVVEPKPAEWSEEDEDIRQSIIKDIKWERDNTPVTVDKDIRKYDKQINWLKSLRPQQKQEWSEEDKAIVNCIAVCLDGQFVSEKARKQCLEWFNKHRRDFLNSPSWKPSEEHLSALLAVFNDPDNIGSATCQLALTDLYEHLKKL